MSRINAGTTTGTALKLTGDVTGDIEFESDGVDRLIMKKDGRFYGTALHNNANAITGTTTQYVASGTYSPTFVAITNCTGSTGVAQYMRVGNVVTVSGRVAVDIITTSSVCNFTLTIPVASAIVLTTQLAGVCTCDPGFVMSIQGEGSVTGKALFTAQNGWATATIIDFFYQYTYVIV